MTGTALAATSAEDPHEQTAVTAAITTAGDEIYLSLNGQRIAKCEVLTETWTTLVRGWHVFALDDVLVIEHDDGRRFVSQMESESLH